MTEKISIPQATKLAWFEAASRRTSRRSYTGERLSQEALERLVAFCDGFRPFDDARVVFVADPATDVFKGIVGGYGKISGAPHVLVVIADDSSPTSQQRAGYTGEAAVLEATVLGAHTCWVGGFFDPRKAGAMIDLAPTEKIVAVSPVGIAGDRPSGSERMMSSMAGSHRRKPLETIAPGNGAWPAWARSGAECARIAPSAVNRQPWRMLFEGDRLVVARDSASEAPRVKKALDCGIAMLHVELGALAKGVEGSWVDAPGAGGSLDIAAFVPAESQPESSRNAS